MTITAQQISSSERQDSLSSIGYTVVYRAKSTELVDVSAIAASSAIPTLGSPYSANSNIVVTSRTFAPVLENEGYIFTATLTYTPFTAGGGDMSDPTDQPARVSYGSLVRTVVADRAYQTGDERGTPTRPVVNTAGDPFDPPPSEEVSDLLISITKNYRDFDPKQIPVYKNTINAASITVAGVRIDAGDGRLMELTSEVAYDYEGVAYDVVNFQVHVNLEGFERRPLNQGYMAYETADDDESKYNITEGDLNDSAENPKNQVQEPQLLLKNGTLTTDKTAAYYFDDDPFQTKWELDWKPLGMPTRKDGQS